MTQLQQLTSSQSSAEITINELIEAMSAIACFAKRAATTSGLTRGYYGGLYIGNDMPNGTITLTDNATNYVVVLRSTGVVSVSTSSTNSLDPLYAKLYKLTTVGGIVTVEVDQRLDDNGFLLVAGSGGGGGGGVGLTGLQFTSDTGSTADSDPGNGLFKWNNATEASATSLFFDNQTADGVSMATFYASLSANGFIYIEQDDDPTKWQLWKWTAVTSASGYYKFPVTLQANGGSIADDKTTLVNFMPAGSATAWGAITGTLASQTDLQTALDAKQSRAPNVQSVTAASTVTPTWANDLVKITAQNVALTLANPTGTAAEGLGFAVRIKDNGTARAISFDTQYRAVGVVLPTTTVISKTLYIGCVWNATDSKVDVLSVAQET